MVKRRLLRFFIRKFTESLPKSEFKRKAQVCPSYTGLSRLADQSSLESIFLHTFVSGMNDAARVLFGISKKEIYKRAKTREYIEFIGFSQGSLEKLKEMCVN